MISPGGFLVLLLILVAWLSFMTGVLVTIWLTNKGRTLSRHDK